MIHRICWLSILPLIAGVGCQKQPLTRAKLESVKVGDRWGYVDEQKRLVIAPSYAKVHEFHEGRAAVWKERIWHCTYIDETGRSIVAEPFDQCQDFSEGRALVQTTDGTWGFLNLEGSFATSTRFAAARPFKNGLAAAMQEHAWGYIGRNGIFMIPPQFAEARPFSEGVAAVRLQHSWGFINQQGQLVIEPQFSSAGSFHSGLAPVVPAGQRKWGYVDAKGKMRIQPVFDVAYMFSENGTAPAVLSGADIVIDQNGTPVPQQAAPTIDKRWFE